MKKNIAFHSNQLCLRGTEVAMFDYADGNEKFLDNISYILSDKKSNLDALPKFQKRFTDRIFLYDDFSECEKFCDENNIKDVYFAKAGSNDGKLIKSTKNHIHAVFQEKDLHGNSYCYISKWLANKMGLPGSFVPYIVNLPKPIKTLKKELNIDEDNIVIGRHGGYDQFNLIFVHKAIKKILKKRNDIVFLFMNTKPFINHKNVMYLQPNFDLKYKSNFIHTCDYMLHGREMGETFGLAIAEFLFHNKPVISWRGGRDQNHVDLLGDKGILYDDKKALIKILKNLKKNNYPLGYYKNIVDEFLPENVMKIFNDQFLSN